LQKKTGKKKGAVRKHSAFLRADDGRACRDQKKAARAHGL